MLSAYEIRTREHEAEGMTRSDAQAVTEAERCPVCHERFSKNDPNGLPHHSTLTSCQL